MFLLCIAACVVGCTSDEASSDSGSSDDIMTLTATSERAARRAYDGAPPVIPHPRLGASCVECHTATGKKVPERGFAPANPHHRTQGLSDRANCRQCHVFQQTDEWFVETDFEGLAQTFTGGDKLYHGAPPVIPHPVFMRENCNACHNGPSARPEIRCDHAARVNCRQCHVVSATATIWPQPASEADVSSAP